MHKKIQLVPGITAEVCHVLWLFEILNHDLHAVVFVLPSKVKAFLAAFPTFQDSSRPLGWNIFLSCHQY